MNKGTIHEPTTSQANNSSVSTKTSYANATKSTPTINFPKKEQAIVLNAIGDLRNSDYIKAIGSLIGPQCIKFISRLSNQRVCIFLDEVKTVDKLLENRSSINIGGYDIHIRRFITPAKRIIISNACPSIPHATIEAKLKDLGLKLVSSINFLRAGIEGDEFSHILSFKRQVFIIPPEDEGEGFPSTFLFTHEQTTYRIFLASDTLVCYNCKEQGHIASTCPNIPETVTPRSVESLDPTHTNQMNPEAEKENEPMEDEYPITEISENPKKRRASFSSPNSPNTEEISNPLTQPTQEPGSGKPEQIFMKPDPINTSKTSRNKKYKTSQNSHPNLNLDGIEAVFQTDPTQFPFNFQDFKKFLDLSIENKDPLNNAYKMTENVDLVIHTMENIYTHLPSKTTKTKFTKILNKLKAQMELEETELSSSISISSQEPYDDVDEHKIRENRIHHSQNSL